MPTFFDYAKRNAESQINWAEVGKEMVTFLKEEDRVRTEKKAKIDKESRDFAKILTETPQGKYTPLNEWALQFASDYQEVRLMQDRLLKSGRIGLNEYTVMRQNGIDGTNDLFATIKGYQNTFAEKMERTRLNENQKLEVWVMENLEELSNFNNSKAVIDPTNGTIGVSRYITDAQGNRVLDKNVSSATSLKNRTDTRFDRFKVNENLSTYVESLGIHIEAVKGQSAGYKTKAISETLDVMQKKDLGMYKDFEKAETLWLESMLAQNEFNLSSVLTDDIITAPNGKPYTFTFDANLPQEPHLILLQNDPNKRGYPKAMYTDAQKKVAIEHLRVKARTMYDYKEGLSVYQEPQRPQRPSRQAPTKVDPTFAMYWGQIRTGDPQQKSAALQAIINSGAAFNLGITKMDATTIPGSLIITDEKGNERTLDYSNVSPSEWASSGNMYHGIVDKDEALKASGGSGTSANVQPATKIQKVQQKGGIFNWGIFNQ